MKWRRSQQMMKSSMLQSLSSKTEINSSVNGAALYAADVYTQISHLSAEHLTSAARKSPIGKLAAPHANNLITTATRGRNASWRLHTIATDDLRAV